MFSNSQGACVGIPAEPGVEWGSPLDRRITSADPFPPHR
jgi:hypothetical protein